MAAPLEVDLKAVEAFVAVAEHQHFGGAAASLGVSTSALSKRLQRLERALDVPLVERDSGGFLGLTPAGRRLVRAAPQLLRMARSMARVAGGASTTLRLAVPAGVGVVAPLMPTTLATLELALGLAHPDVAVTSVPTAFSRLVPDLLEGAADAVLTFGAPPDDSVVSTRLSQVHRVGVVAATHPVARRGVVDVEEFARLPMILGRGLPPEYMHPFVLADVRPLERARLVELDATTTAHVAQRLLSGREVTVVPVALTAHLPPELVRVPLRGVPPTWYHALRRRDDERPALLTAVDLLVDFTESISRAALEGRR